MSRRLTRLAVTALAGTCGLALAVPGASAAPKATALPSAFSISCPDLGEVVVHVHGQSLVGASVDAGPVTLAGSSVTASGAFGQVREGSIKASAITCEPVSLTGVQAAQVLGAANAKKVGASTKVNARLQFGVMADTAAVISAAVNSPARTSAVAQAVVNDPAGYGPVQAFPSTWGVSSYLSGVPSIAAAYRAIGERVIYSGSAGNSLNVTASIVKVQIMATVMYQAQQQGRSLTSWERSQLVPMITQSSNDAATALWNHVGGRPAVARVLGLMGLRNTVPGSGSYWGLTVTSAPDQVVLVDHFARHNPVLSDTMRAYGLSLMRQVESDQHWGVTAGPGSDNAVKNGWLPRSDGWHVNSVGYLDDAPRKYVMAVLSQSPSASMGTLISRIEGASRLVWAHQRGVRGDWNGDGLADVAGVRNDHLYVSASTGTSLAAPRVASGGGWGSMKWVGTPGDVTGDGITDIMAINSVGHLMLYPGTGSFGVGSGRDLGRGWGQLQIVATPGDLTGDGVPDLLARTATGQLWLYTTQGTSSPRRLRVAGVGWGGMRAILGSGDFNNDGRGDVLGVTKAGTVNAYNSTGTALIGPLGGSRASGITDLVASPGDLNGDAISDLVVRTSNGMAGIRAVGPNASIGAVMTTGVSLSGWTMLF